MTKPYVGVGRVASALAATFTKELTSVAGSPTDASVTGVETSVAAASITAKSILLEVVGAGTVSWTLDIQGKAADGGTYTNWPYRQVAPGDLPGAITDDQLSITDTTRRFYKVIDPPPFVQVVGTRTTGTLTILAALSSAVGDGDDGRVTIEGAILDDAAFGVATQPIVPVGFLADQTSPDSVNEGDVGTPRMGLDRIILMQGAAAENDPVLDNPVLIGGRYDASDRTLGDGDVGAIAIDAAGKVKLSATITGTSQVQDDTGGTSTQIKGDDQGVAYVRPVGQGAIKSRSLVKEVAVTGTFTTAIQLTASDYLCDDVIVAFRNRNTDAEGLLGDVAGQTQEVKKGDQVKLGPVDPRQVYLKAHTTAGDDADGTLILTDRPDFRQFILDAIRANSGGAYWPLDEKSGTEVADIGDYNRGLTLDGVTLAGPGVFGLGGDWDGSNDTAKNTVVKTKTTVMTVVETDGAATLDDTGGGFTAAIRDGAHWVAVKDASGDVIHGYIGTADVDGDGTKVNIYNSVARTTQSWVEGAGAAYVADDTTFNVYKETINPAAAFTFGCWVNLDDVTSDQFIIGKNDSGTGSVASYRQSGMIFVNSGITPISFTARTENSGTAQNANSTKPLRTGTWYFVVAVFVPSTSWTLYVNGIQEGQDASVAAAMDDAVGPFSIGGRNLETSSGNLFLNGRVAHPFWVKAAMNVNWIETAYEMSRR